MMFKQECTRHWRFLGNPRFCKTAFRTSQAPWRACAAAFALIALGTGGCKHPTEKTRKPRPAAEDGTGQNSPTGLADLGECPAVEIQRLDPQGGVSAFDAPQASGTFRFRVTAGTGLQLLGRALAEEVTAEGFNVKSRQWLNVRNQSGVEGWISRVHAECSAGGTVDDPDDNAGSGDEDCHSSGVPVSLQWPVPANTAISQRFGNAIKYQDCKFHTGIDVFAGRGEKILAAADGKVVHVGHMWFQSSYEEEVEGRGRGPFAVIIEHVPGVYYTTYGHNRRVLVQSGDCVKKGQEIAEIGSLGYSEGPHLHFEIVRNRSFTGSWIRPFNDVCVIREPFNGASGYKSPNKEDVKYDY